MFIPMLIGAGLVVGGIATVKAASKVPSGPFARTEKVPPYYNGQVRQALRRTRAFSHFSRRQHTITEGRPEMVDSTGMTIDQKEAWIRSVERVKAWNRSR